MTEDGVPPGGSVKYVNGRKIILDKDGKPCRSCNSLLDFKAATRGGGGTAGVVGMFGAAAGASAANSGDSETTPRDCPPDSEELGRSTWTFLHTMAATYPDQPNCAEQSDMKTFMSIFSKIYPCWYCAEDFQRWMKKEGNEPKVQSKEDLSNWLCDAHNEVNKKLGKPTFDCKLWRQRWKDGWKDGRCD